MINKKNEETKMSKIGWNKIDTDTHGGFICTGFGNGLTDTTAFNFNPTIPNGTGNGVSLS